MLKFLEFLLFCWQLPPPPFRTPVGGPSHLIPHTFQPAGPTLRSSKATFLITSEREDQGRLPPGCQSLLLQVQLRVRGHQGHPPARSLTGQNLPHLPCHRGQLSSLECASLARGDQRLSPPFRQEHTLLPFPEPLPAAAADLWFLSLGLTPPPRSALGFTG